MAEVVKKLINLFNCVVIMVPLVMAAVFSFVYICGGWETIMEGHSPAFYSLETISNVFSCACIALLWLAVVCTCVFCYRNFKGE